MFENIQRILFRKRRERIYKQHILDYLFWECTLRCNLNCLHCGSDCLKISETPDMPVKDFIEVLDDIRINYRPANFFVCITGGEPLLRKDLEDAGRQIAERGYGWGIVSNGLLFTKERFDSLLKAGMCSLSFSIDGFEKEHAFMRQNDVVYSKVIEGIKIITEYKRTWSRPFAFDVITCVHKGNLAILPKLRDYLMELGVENWRIFTIFPSGRAAKNDFSLSHEEYLQVMSFIEETRKTEKNARRRGESYIHVSTACEGYLGKYDNKVNDGFFSCEAGITVGSVMCDGSVSGCLSIRGDFIQGNIYKESFVDIWNDRFQIMRDRSWTKKGSCGKCKDWKNCMGNGMHLHKDMESGPGICNMRLLGENC